MPPKAEVPSDAMRGGSPKRKKKLFDQERMNHQASSGKEGAKRQSRLVPKRTAPARCIHIRQKPSLSMIPRQASGGPFERLEAPQLVLWLADGRGDGPALEVSGLGLLGRRKAGRVNGMGWVVWISTLSERHPIPNRQKKQPLICKPAKSRDWRTSQDDAGGLLYRYKSHFFRWHAGEPFVH